MQVPARDSSACSGNCKATALAAPLPTLTTYTGMQRLVAGLATEHMARGQVIVRFGPEHSYHVAGDGPEEQVLWTLVQVDSMGRCCACAGAPRRQRACVPRWRPSIAWSASGAAISRRSWPSCTPCPAPRRWQCEQAAAGKRQDPALDTVSI